ncbi:unnamed protein product [Durusdinium trenchii]|uniref:Kinesin motor domain-containing protein n=1 Tax=Durusdinium trenchii TaxID=1381693 RepID=A0ABP0NC53_9DINO
MLDVALESAAGTVKSTAKSLRFERKRDDHDETSCLLHEALKEVQLAKARAHHAEEEMSRCQEAASKVKGNLCRMAIVRPFSEPEKENCNWMQVLGPHELQVAADSLCVTKVAPTSRRRMSTGCMPDSVQQRCNLSSPRVMDFEHILGHEDNRIFQALKPDIDASVMGEAFCIFVCGAPSSDKASLADRLAAKVCTQLETDAAATEAKVYIEMFEVYADQHRDLLAVNSHSRGRRHSGLEHSVLRVQLFPNNEAPMTTSLRELIRESRSLQLQRLFPVSHVVMSFHILRSSKNVGHVVILDVDSFDKSWTCRSSQTNLWQLLGGFQDCKTTMLLMLDPAQCAQADTLKTLQFGRRLQSSLLRFGPRHIDAEDLRDDPCQGARETNNRLREELGRLQKETSEVLKDVRKMKLEIEKKDSEIHELRRRSARLKMLRQSPKLLPACSAVRPVREASSPQRDGPRQTAGSIQANQRNLRAPGLECVDDKHLSPGRTLTDRPCGALLRRPSQQTEKSSRPALAAQRLLSPSPKVAVSKPKARPERMDARMQAPSMERVRPPSSKKEQCAVRILPRRFVMNSKRPVLAQTLQTRAREPTVIARALMGARQCASHGGHRSNLPGAQCKLVKDKCHALPRSFEGQLREVVAGGSRDTSLSSSSSSICQNWNHATRQNRMDLPLLDLTHLSQNLCLREGVTTPHTPRGRPPVAWWNSAEVTAPASARGRAPSGFEDRRARSLYIVEVATPRTALSYAHTDEEGDAPSPMTILRPVCPIPCPRPEEGTGRHSLSTISVSSDEEEIRGRLSQELCQQNIGKENDQALSNRDAQETIPFSEGQDHPSHCDPELQVFQDLSG